MMEASVLGAYITVIDKGRKAGVALDARVEAWMYNSFDMAAAVDILISFSTGSTTTSVPVYGMYEVLDF